MPKYTLTYFNGRGLAELSRWLFALADQPYDDVRFQYEGDQKEWLAFKPSTPFSQLPLLEVDDFKLGQSNTIAHFLAHEFGLAGKSQMDFARCSMIQNCVTEVVYKVYPIYFEKDEAKKAELKKTFEEYLQVQLKCFEKFLEENGGNGHFVSDSITVADVAFAVGLDKLDDFHIDMQLDKYPLAKKCREIVTSNPKIVAWVAKRPASAF